ncbi:MAG: hypothetical protein ACJAVN_000166 [Roseivirga sp.]|jgi:hypothetical protein
MTISFFRFLLFLCFASLLPSCNPLLREVDFQLSEEEVNGILDHLSFEDTINQNIHMLEVELLNESSGILEIIVTENIGQADLGLSGHMNYRGFNVFLYGSSFLQSTIPNALVSQEVSTIHWRPGLNTLSLLIKRRSGKIVINSIGYLPSNDILEIPVPDDIF